MNTYPHSNSSSQPPTHRGIGFTPNSNAQPGINQSYEAYSSYSGAQAPDESILKLERDMAIQEFKDDRDYIIETLKQNIKNHEFEEAQQLIQEYRAAIKIDETFSMLATMVKDGIEKDKKIEKFKTVLELTPEDEYVKRIGICQDILTIVPDDERYQAEIARCQAELDRINHNNRNIAQKNNASKNDDILACPKTAIVLMVLDGLCAIGSIGNGVASGVVFYLLAIGMHYIMCSNLKFNPLKALPDGAKIALSILLFFIGGAFL